MHPESGKGGHGALSVAPLRPEGCPKVHNEPGTW